MWAHGKGVSGKDPSLITIGARIACLSSCFRFLQRMDIVVSNPWHKLERPRTSTPPARGLSADEVQRLLAILPDTPQGLRDRAIILTLTLTGRRRSEVFRMTAGDLSFENGVCFYSTEAKAEKTGRRELPQPALDALRAALAARERCLENMCPPMNRCSPPRRPQTARDYAAPASTVVFGGIWRKLVFSPLGSTFCGTSRPSSGGMPGRAWRRCLGSWTTRRWRSPPPTCGGFRDRRTGAGDEWRRRLESDRTPKHVVGGIYLVLACAEPSTDRRRRRHTPTVGRAGQAW